MTFLWLRGLKNPVGEFDDEGLLQEMPQGAEVKSPKKVRLENGKPATIASAPHAAPLYSAAKHVRQRLTGAFHSRPALGNSHSTVYDKPCLPSAMTIHLADDHGNTQVNLQG